MSQEPGPDYEAPTVEEVDTEDSPAVTAAGDNSQTDFSDLRLKHAIRPLEERSIGIDQRPQREREPMSQEPKPDYEAPSVEEVNTEDSPAVTAAGGTSTISDQRLKRSLRPLENAISQEPKQDYEAPSVDEVNTEDSPAVTAAGEVTGDQASDVRLKRSLRPLENAISEEPKPDYEAPSVEEVNTEDSPAVTAAGDDSTVDVDGPPSDLLLKRSLRPLGGTIIRSS
jgi:hypothetical protein